MKAYLFHILLALSNGELHATGIVRRVRRQTEGAVRLWPVTLHRAIDKLQQQGWIVELKGPGEHPEGESRRRRYYRLTDAGATALAGEAERLQSFAEVAERNLDADRWKTR